MPDFVYAGAGLRMKKAGWGARTIFNFQIHTEKTRLNSTRLKKCALVYYEYFLEKECFSPSSPPIPLASPDCKCASTFLRSTLTDVSVSKPALRTLKDKNPRENFPENKREHGKPQADRDGNETTPISDERTSFVPCWE